MSRKKISIMKKRIILLLAIITGMYCQGYSQCTAMAQPYSCTTSSCDKIRNSDFSCTSGWSSPGCDFGGWVSCWRVSHGDPYYPWVCNTAGNWNCYSHEAGMIVNTVSGYAANRKSTGIFQNTTITNGSMYFIGLDYKVPASINYNCASVGCCTPPTLPGSLSYGALDNFYVKFADNNSFATNNCNASLPTVATQQTVSYIQNAANTGTYNHLNLCVKANNNYESLWIYAEQNQASANVSNLIVDNIYMYEADAGANQTACSGTISLGTGCPNIPGATYSWSPAAGLSSTNTLNTTLNVSALAPGTYTYTLTINYNGCVLSDNVTITVNSVPVNLGPNQTVCGPINLNAGSCAGCTYTWTLPGTCLYGGANAQACVTGNYCVTVTDANGCTGTDCVYITIVNPPSITATANTTNICPGDPVNLGVSGTCTGCTYSWSSGATTASTTVYPSSTTTYTVTATNSGGCTSTSSVTINVSQNCLVNQFCKYIQNTGFSDVGAAIESTPDGGFVVVGSMMESANDKDLYFAKFDANYNMVPGSRKRIGDNGTGTIFTDAGYSVVVGTDAYFVIGETRSTGTPSSQDVFVARLDATTFNIDWANRYDGGRDEAGVKGVLASSPTGAVTLIITGQTTSFTPNNNDIFALKINTTAVSGGSVVALNSYKVLNAGANEYGTDIIRLSGTTTYVISARYLAAGNEDLFWFKIDDNLNPVTGIYAYRTTGVRNDYVYGIEEIGDYVYLVGRTASWPVAGNDDAYVLEINKNSMAPTGAARSYNITNIDQVYKAQKTADNNLVLVGDYQTTSPTVSPTRAFVMKIRINPGQANHLQKIWAYALSNAYPNALYNVCETVNNHVLVTGKYGISASDQEIFVSKINDQNPGATTCCYKAPTVTEGSGLTFVDVKLDPKGGSWTRTAHKDQKEAGTLVILCEDYTPTGSKSISGTTVSTEELKAITNNSRLTVYPNPSNGRFRIKLNNSNEVIRKIRVVDVNGKQLNPDWNITEDGTAQVNLNAVANGIYFLEVSTDSGEIRAKISIMK